MGGNVEIAAGCTVGLFKRVCEGDDTPVERDEDAADEQGGVGAAVRRQVWMRRFGMEVDSPMLPGTMKSSNDTIASPQYSGETIYFWDKTTPGASRTTVYENGKFVLPSWGG